MIRFGHLDIDYDRRVLTPRPWTVRQSEWAAELLHTLPDGPVLELCAGAGQIGLLTVATVPRSLVCVDFNPAAGELTERNAERGGLGHLVEVRTAPLQTALRPDERFALIIADPPWVPSAQVGRYPEDPLSAIDGGGDGLDVAGLCLELIGRHLQPGGAALLQLGTAAQVAGLREDLRDSSLHVQEVRESPEEGVLVHLTNAGAPDEDQHETGHETGGA